MKTGPSYKRHRTVCMPPQRRTSIRLEQVFWDALEEVSTIKRMTRNELVGAIDNEKDRGMTLTNAIKVFLVLFYRNRSNTK